MNASALVRWVGLGGWLVVAARPLAAQGAAQDGAARGSPFVEQARAPFADFELPWFEVETTYTTEHFDPVFLPFRYECRQGEPDENQVYTFPHLLSFKFDHVPDNLTRAHPFFVFKRSRSDLESLLDEDVDGETVARFLADWGCNVGFRGTLIQDRDSYGGRLLAHDESGRTVLDRGYDVRFGYFELMGAMVRDWMAFRELDVSNDLGVELDRPMCADLRAVRLLGTAALTREKSRREFRIYEDVLDVAPEFAEVRFWLANQREWANGDDDEGREGRAAVLESHLVPFALIELDARSGKDAELKTRAIEWIERARAISPHDGRYAEIEIEERDSRWNLTLGQLEPYIADSQASPAYTYLHRQLAFQLRSRHALERALPIAISGLRSHLDTERDGLWIELAIGFLLAGEHTRAIECARRGLLDTDGGYVESLLHLALGQALRERLRLVEAVEALAAAYAVEEDPDILALAILAGHEAGDPTVEARFEEAGVGGTAWGPLLATRRFLALGWTDQALAVLPACAFLDRHWPDGFEDPTQIIDIRLETEVLRADVAHQRGDVAGFEQAAVHAWKLAPLGGRTRALLVRAFGVDGELPAEWRAPERFLMQPLDRALEAALAPHTDEARVEGRRRAERLEEERRGLSEDEARRMWQSRGPWEVEGAVLELARAGDVERAVDLYVDYAGAAEELSDALQIMTRIFVRRLLELGDGALRAKTLARLAALPSGPGWHVEKEAELLYRAEEYEQAVPLFRKAARMQEGRWVWYHYYLGVCMRELGDFDGSVTELETFLSSHPDDANAQLQVARTYDALGRHEDTYAAMLRRFELREDDDDIEEERSLLRGAASALAEADLARGDAATALAWLEPLEALGAGSAEVEALVARCRGDAPERD